MSNPTWWALGGACPAGFEGDWKEWGQRLRGLIDELGMNMEAFGQAIGVSRVTVSNWCRGRYRMDPGYRNLVGWIWKVREQYGGTNAGELVQQMRQRVRAQLAVRDPQSVTIPQIVDTLGIRFTRITNETPVPL